MKTMNRVLDTASKPFPWERIYFALCISLGFVIWWLPAPSGLDPKAWKLFAVFAYTILGMILKPLPMGALTITSLTVLLLTKVLTFEEAFQGFSHSIVWLITIAFFFARGFIKTGLGMRIAYSLMSLFGRSTLGIAYSLVFTDWILGSAIPSVTARAGGIMFPLVSSISKAFGSYPNDQPRKIGAYLTKTLFQCGAGSSAMFLTAMAANPIVQGFAEKCGVTITWSSWALAASVPGLCMLIAVPWILYKIYPPEIKNSTDSIVYAKEKLRELGKISRQEWILILSFALMIFLWSAADIIGVSPTITALFGLSLLLATEVLTWDDLLGEKVAFDTLFWFAILLTMATMLSKFGFMDWFSSHIGGRIAGLNPTWSFLSIVLIYYYSHYLFASNTSHITALYTPFLLLAIAAGTPPALAALSLGFISSLFGSLTAYGSGPAPIFFGSGYVTSKDWWQLAFLISLVNLFIWIGIGSIWWKILGVF